MGNFTRSIWLPCYLNINFARLRQFACGMLRKLVPGYTSLHRALAFRMSSTATNGKLKGKVAVVTASTDGIGLAIARRLAADGASVMVSSRKEQNVQKAVNDLQKEGLTVYGIVCHVAKAEDRKNLLKEAISKFGGIDILVSNAAVNPGVGHVLECEESVWDKIFEVNVKCAFLLSKEVLPYIRKRGGGSIVYVSSIGGYQPFDILGAYSVSKTTLLGLTKAASLGLAAENIRVNCVAPGIVETRFSSALHETESAKEAALSNVPMRRLAQPHEIAGVVSFLCSEDASYITGETIIASGVTENEEDRDSVDEPAQIMTLEEAVANVDKLMVYFESPLKHCKRAPNALMDASLCCSQVIIRN